MTTKARIKSDIAIMENPELHKAWGEQFDVWRPNPGRQTFVLTCEEKEILYGGRRGGGKTDAGIVWLLYDKDKPYYRALVIRRNADDLSDWIDRARRIYAPLGARITGGGNKPAVIRFPSGALIRTGHLKDKNAYTKYQGHEYHKILIEELTQIPQEINYLMLIASCRSTHHEIQPQVFATCNPDGPGFSWVKKRWGLSGIPAEPIRTYDEESQSWRIFVPAGIDDNPHLDENDPGYRHFLNSLPDGLRQAWKEGSWDEPVIEGAYYTKELLKARQEGRIKAIPHDPRLRVHTVWDLGAGKQKSDHNAMSIGFWQRDAVSTRLIDFYGNDGFGLEHYINYIEARAKEKNWTLGTHFLPHDSSKTELGTGLTILNSAEKLGLKPIEQIVRLPLGDGMFRVRSMFNRIYINAIPETEPFLNAIRNYRRDWDEKLLKYKDTPVEDWSCHPADMLRYAATIEARMTNESPEDRRTRMDVEDGHGGNNYKKLAKRAY